MTGSQDMRCKACDGSGLLMDDEEWRYTCSICNGDGFVSKYEAAENDIVDTDITNRTLE
ncbi:hypothetical protein J416_06982 [Gracilibacillus halophilus YIM-C55.5]|uniref:Uncharacterized protein n=1 Tax=Gracilibacillus halophilus YIM-C55.5 TaxID=1308866 RepID=N4WS06_9BACI|nr:hypothetical protein [Gracilibacillus halophilus]ENH97170.1 hypothetical protein J416_06982 [Gracilibacillus halophilus YIM-C55.5]